MSSAEGLMHWGLQELLDQGDEANPRVLADKLLTVIPEDQLYAVCRIALRHWVRNEIGQRRRGHRIPPVMPAHSPKVAAIRDAAPQWLRDRVAISAGNYKLMGDCDRSDLLAIAKRRRQSAARLTANADHYQYLADLLESYDVEIVKELPVEILVSLGT